MTNMTTNELIRSYREKAVGAREAYDRVIAKTPAGYTSNGEPSGYSNVITHASATSLAWRQAYAMAVGISSDEASDIISEIVKQRKESKLCTTGKAHSE